MKRHGERRTFSGFLDRVGDLILLNLLFLVGCIPIVTVGVSISAMFYVTLRIHRGQGAYITRDFFRAFGQNAKQGILLGLLWALLAVILVVDVYVLRHLMQYDVFFKIVFILLGVVILRLAMIWLYTFPVLAQFDNTVWGTIRSARRLSGKHISHTLAILLVTIFPLAIGAVLPYVLEWEIVLFALVGFSALASFCTRFYADVFDEYVEEPPQTVERAATTDFGMQ